MDSLQYLGNELSTYIVEQVVFRCDSSYETFSLAYVSKFFNETIKALSEKTVTTDRLNLEEFCYRFSVIDTIYTKFLIPGLTKESCDYIKNKNKVYVNKLEIFRNYKDLESKVSYGAGVSLVIVRKGTDFDDLYDLAQALKLEVVLDVDMDFISAEETSASLITNDIFEESELLTCEQHVQFVKKQKCNMPGYISSFALCCLFKDRINPPYKGLFGRLGAFVPEKQVFGQLGRKGKVFGPFGIGSEGKMSISISCLAIDQTIYGVGGERKIRVFTK